MDSLRIGAAGLIAATARFDASAQRTAAGAGDPVTERVEQITAKASFDASVAVVRTSDEMLKSLLDIKV